MATPTGPVALITVFSAGVLPRILSAWWRTGYVDARIAAQRPRGFAQFNFVKENNRPNRVEDAVRSLHHASRR